MQVDKPSIRITPELVIGLGVMLLGFLLTLDNFGLLEARYFVRFWPILLIAVGLTRFTRSAQSGTRVEGYVLILVGLGLLLVNLHVLKFRQALALFLLGIGALIVRRAARGRSAAPSTVLDPSRHIDLVAVLGGVQRAVSAQDFRGGHATAVMGGCEIDLSRASVDQGEAVLNTVAFWGGIDIKVPVDWTVEMQGVALLGGFNDSSRRPDDDGKKLIVTGYAVMGGVEVHN
jgi:predicted membrane protein